MVFPKEKEVYSYNGKKYIVIANTLFSDMYVQNYLEENDKDCSHFQSFNWWKFMFKSKHIGSIKMSESY